MVLFRPVFWPGSWSKPSPKGQQAAGLDDQSLKRPIQAKLARSDPHLYPRDRQARSLDLGPLARVRARRRHTAAGMETRRLFV